MNNRRLLNISIEASNQLDKTCGNELWRNLGFEAFDSFQVQDQRARANYYYGQFQTARELQEVFG